MQRAVPDAPDYTAVRARSSARCSIGGTNVFHVFHCDFYRGPVRYRVQARSWTLRVHDGRRRLDDRVRHLPRVRRDGKADRESRSAAHRMDPHRCADARRCAVLRRAGGDDAAGGRAVRLPARSVLAAVGIPLRLDALHGDSDRHDRGGRRRLRALHRLSDSVVCRGSLPRSTDSLVARLRGLTLDGAIARHPARRAADVDEHARARLGQADSERLHNDQDRRAPRADCRRSAGRLESAGGDGQLRRPVDTTRCRASRAGPRRDDDLRHVHRAVRGAGGVALFRRRLEQHHLHRRRGQGSATQYSPGARFRHGDRHLALSARQRRLSRHASIRRAATGPCRSRRDGDARSDLPWPRRR